jgi:hypothetical protein
MWNAAIMGVVRMKDNLRIEIKKSPYRRGTYCVRIGDISGSGESSNISKQEVLDEISDAMKELSK